MSQLITDTKKLTNEEIEREIEKIDYGIDILIGFIKELEKIEKRLEERKRC